MHREELLGRLRAAVALLSVERKPNEVDTYAQRVEQVRDMCRDILGPPPEPDAVWPNEWAPGRLLNKLNALVECPEELGELNARWVLAAVELWKVSRGL